MIDVILIGITNPECVGISILFYQHYIGVSGIWPGSLKQDIGFEPCV